MEEQSECQKEEYGKEVFGDEGLAHLSVITVVDGLTFTVLEVGGSVWGVRHPVVPSGGTQAGENQGCAAEACDGSVGTIIDGFGPNAPILWRRDLRSWTAPEMSHAAFFPLHILNMQQICGVAVQSIIQLDHGSRIFHQQPWSRSIEVKLGILLFVSFRPDLSRIPPVPRC